MAILVTGAAGFIGFHVCQALLSHNEHVVGIDNLNNYYDVSLKKARLDILATHKNFTFIKADIAKRQEVEDLFNKHCFDRVVHLSAQAGVRYSIDHPHCYIDSNVTGFLHILEGCRQVSIKHLVYASTSSVYGAKESQPYQEEQSCDHPLALYAATKKANELMAHSYASLYDTPCTGLRFFTVYGPWTRPDMAIMKFAHNIMKGKPIDVYNEGHMARDFTYIDDIVSGIVKTLETPAAPDDNWDAKNPNPATSYAPYRIYNLGNGKPASLMGYIEALEQALGKDAICNMMPLQPGDVPSTHADTTLLERAVGYKPTTDIKVGVQAFAEWFKDYYKYA